MRTTSIFLLALLTAACTSASDDDGPMETCANDPECWRGEFQSILSQPEVMSLDNAELQRCQVSVEFGPFEHDLAPIENEDIFVISANSTETSFSDTEERTLAVKAATGANLREFVGLAGFTKYEESEAPTTQTTIECAGRVQAVSELWVLTRSEPRPEDGVLRPRAGNADAFEIPWEQLVEESVRSARERESRVRTDFSYWYAPSNDEVEPPEEGE